MGSNVKGYRDYRGVTVVGAWAWDKELGFGITTEIDVSEAYQVLQSNLFVINLLTFSSALH